MSRLSELRTGRWQGAPLSLISPTSGFRLRGRNDGCAKVSNGGNPRHPNRHSRDGGNPQRGAGDGFPSPRERREAAAHPQSSFPRRRESTEGARRWVPSPPERRWAAAHTQSSFPRRRESTEGGRRWVPLSTRTTGGGGAPTIVIPATAGIHRGGPAMGSRLHRNDGGRRRTHNRHSRDGGNPQRGAGDGFPSPRGTTGGGGAPQSSFPRRRESTEGGRRWVPVSTERREAAAHPQSSFPRRRESTEGGRRWVPVSTGTTGGGGAPHNRHSRDGGNPQRGAGDGFPSPPERRWAAAHHNRHSRDGGNPRRGAGDGFPSPTGTTGGGGRTPQSSFPRRRESTEGGAMGSRLHRNDGRRRRTGTTVRRRRTHNRHSRDGGNPRRGAAFLSAAPNRYRGGRGLARRRTCDTMTSAGIDGRPTRRRPAAPTLVGSRQPAAQRTCQS